MADATFHGVDLGWMQAQWRDCADKAAQLAIFRDMTGGKATIQQILEAVGEPDYMGPEIVELKSGRFAPEEDETIIRMFRAGATCPEIGAALNRNSVAITNRIFILRKKGVRIEREKADEEVHAVPAQYPDGSALPLELGELPGKDALEAVAATLRALLDEEEMLCDRQRVVGNMIREYRQKLGDLLAMAGGGLGNA